MGQQESRVRIFFVAVRIAHVGSSLGLYKILSLPIMYGVWHIKEGLGGGSYIAQMSCDRNAVVCAMQMGGGN